MRIISQDGKMNLSLDSIHLTTAHAFDTWMITARDGFWSRPIELAVYSSKSKCEKVFDSIITACSNGYKIVELPPDDEVLS